MEEIQTALQKAIRDGIPVSELLRAAQAAANAVAEEAERSKRYPEVKLDLDSLEPLLLGSSNRVIYSSYCGALKALKGRDSAAFMRELFALFCSCHAHFGEETGDPRWQQM